MAIDGNENTAAHAEAFRRQAQSCDSLGSPMYRDLFTFLATCCVPGSTLARRLEPSSHPIHDAVPLRLAGEVHRRVLEGKAPALDSHYPTVGGEPGDTFPQEFLNFALTETDVIERALTTQVQTNEVRRSVALRQASRWISARGWEEFTLLEVGASAGLNLWFDCYPAEWFDGLEPPLPAHLMGGESTANAHASARLGCDIHPLDASDDAHMLRLRSFVWPDHTERHTRLSAAIDIARAKGTKVTAASADEWIDARLAETRGAAVVFHSIVWQYLGRGVQTRLRESLHQRGSHASLNEPLIWLRMEPNGPLADLRATVWIGGREPDEVTLADVGYHGEFFAWKSPVAAT